LKYHTERRNQVKKKKEKDQNHQKNTLKAEVHEQERTDKKGVLTVLWGWGGGGFFGGGKEPGSTFIKGLQQQENEPKGPVGGSPLGVLSTRKICDFLAKRKKKKSI